MAVETITILYIDDDPDDLLIFGDFIISLHPTAQVLKAESGEEGLAILNRLETDQQALPHLIILDMNMPRMDGRQTLRAIRGKEKWEDIPVVIFTTSSNIVDVEFCKSYGSECITKPMNYNSLHQTMKEVLSHSRVPL